ncbi:MAG TPA: hypothetical protein VFF04_01830 [Candidatus Babeliales bacterium]|nr:hypothetical protein [Candidatus Babeliales bacterium]
MNKQISKRIGLLTIISLLNNSLILCMQTNAGPISYAEIGDKLISSYGIVEQPKPALTQAEKEEQDKKVNLDLPQFTEQEKQKIVWGMLSRFESKHSNNTTNEQQSYKYDAERTLIDDLELFYCRDVNDHAQHIFSKLDLTETTFGKAMLAMMLSKPTADITTLRNRQSLIAALVEDETFFNEVQALVTELKKSEPALYALWVENNKGTQEAIENLYPFFFKKNALVAETNIRAGNVGTAIGLTWDIALMSALYYQYLVAENELYNKGFLPPDRGVPLTPNVFNSTLGIFKSLLPFYDVKQFLSLREPETTTFEMCGLTLQLRNEDDRSVAKWMRGTLGGVKIIYILSKLVLSKKILDSACLTRDTANAVQERMIGAATFINGMMKVKKLAKKHAVLVDGLSSYANIDKILKGSLVKSKDFKELVIMLQTETFKGKPSFFSYTGRVLAAYERMKSSKDNMAATLQILGELDAYLSIAKLVKKYANERVKYSFVQYVDSDKPYLALHQFWNPQIDPSVVVANSIELGVNNARNVILTGSNTGGKSTLLKAMMLSVLMAQTIGIAPTHDMTLRPFDFIGCSMNVVDNTASGKSLYQAEVDRVVSIVDAAQTTEHAGGKSFMVMDELFRGTSPEKADKETYQCAQRLNALDSTMFILATHYFTNPPRMEAETDGVCKNYKVDAYIDTNGKIVRTFTLEEGISTSNIAANILQDAFAKNDKK